jgi:hypothetical protein
MDSDEKNEFYDKLKERLLETTTWPSLYLYKFIVPSNGTGVKEIESVFDDTKATIIKKLSKNGKYTSVSISLILENPDKVIEKYLAVATVKGLISL